MYFDSLLDLWQMAGHGVYVWSCYALFVALLGINLWHGVSQRRRAIKQVRALLRRNM